MAAFDDLGTAMHAGNSTSCHDKPVRAVPLVPAVQTVVVPAQGHESRPVPVMTVAVGRTEMVSPHDSVSSFNSADTSLPDHGPVRTVPMVAAIRPVMVTREDHDPRPIPVVVVAAVRTHVHCGSMHPPHANRSMVILVMKVDRQVIEPTAPREKHQRCETDPTIERPYTTMFAMAYPPNRHPFILRQGCGAARRLATVSDPPAPGPHSLVRHVPRPSGSRRADHHKPPHPTPA